MISLQSRTAVLCELRTRCSDTYVGFSAAAFSPTLHVLCPRAGNSVTTDALVLTLSSLLLPSFASAPTRPTLRSIEVEGGCEPPPREYFSGRTIEIWFQEVFAKTKRYSWLAGLSRSGNDHKGLTGRVFLRPHSPPVILPFLFPALSF